VIPKEYGGRELTDWRYRAIVTEEQENQDCGSILLNHNDIVAYFTQSCTPAQRSYWLPRIVSEKLLLAVAMSEPEMGRDLAGMHAEAVRSTDGSFYTLTGRKMWISSGAVADIVIVAALTDPSRSASRGGMSLFAVERGTPGFETAKRFTKVGRKASDTCLLTLDKVKVPAKNLIGEEGQGFKYLMQHLAAERLSIAVATAAASRRALGLTLSFVSGREAFGGVLSQLSSMAARLARLRVQVQLVTTLVDKCIEMKAAGRLSAEQASVAKVAASELCTVVAEVAMQCQGGYGYLDKNPVARIWRDQRVTRIYGGANEVQLEVIAKGLGMQPQRLHRSKL
jgi:alkylation response protein AidB-like acyl-CoA dehydrogenase